MSVRLFFRFSHLHLAAAFAALLGGMQAARADITDWARSEGGQMRVASLAVDANGVVRGVLQIEPKDGWITYWREPGEAGIPPQITPDPTSGAMLTAMAYPVPKLIENGDITDIGYDHAVSLPFQLKVTDPAAGGKIDLTAFIGVCQNICIPFEAKFSVDRGTAGDDDSEERRLLEEARETLPEAASDDFKVIDFHITPDKTMLGVQLQLPENAPKETEIFIAGPSGFAYYEPQNLVRDKRKLSFYMNIKGLPKTYQVQGNSWPILVKSGDRAMETMLNFPKP
ncbi:UNVERIFIED_ORG: DsbC/DsbD-like thiol-disulfide interchange protein [Rhizobium sp. SORGH_AS260]|jgi:DsbC/DsbD-like thiol-disulfide interchange protein|uniref:protein-disulfide reductase DsbD domain-containing protein n=1 Tax=Agrobacterium sp. SORGH_AS_0440 TaxID=3041757 RepID=UPI0027803F2A|nr:protein-disulfide reductase DsbD domain-containing protein [Agrobacterium sp. SORGH_AS_0440]MDP9732522.1 DsbC/DsbD-like thiol-disulfide interchange protein [Rhizobium sp. SORGH_AS_0285]MDP9755647.1 DsbC/DsbD-like thiol-disulfide interchange protein [Rhizobium sp. SORGH_AS_0260]MDR6081694.1 DsbC/DsbD-like thiol-disulfide interchange protein [Agrobacterium sp. SORGH_AS_0440]